MKEHNGIESIKMKPFTDSSGAVLIGLIIVISILSALGAGMLSQSTTEDYHAISGKNDSQAYYLAESGLRYAAAKLRGEGSLVDQLQQHGAYTVGNAGTFTVHFDTYVFDVTSGGGTNTLAVQVPFGTVPDLDQPNVAGYLVTDEGTPQDFDSVTISDTNGDSLQFVKNSGSWTAQNGTRVRLCIPVGTSYTYTTTGAEGGDLNVGAVDDSSRFPLYNGRFSAGGRTYRYRMRDSATGNLLGVKRPPDDTSSWVDPSGNLILQNFLEMRSTGTTGAAALQTSRVITYYIPLSESNQSEFYDFFEDRSHWEASSKLGSHAIESIGGDNALRVTGTSDVSQGGPAPKSALIELNPATTGIDVNYGYSASGHFLSYDTQVKIGFDASQSPDYGYYPVDSPIPSFFAAGVSFRLKNSGDSYGVSFMRGSLSSPPDNIDNEIVPDENVPMIVLWKDPNPDQTDERIWIAAKYLTPVVLFSDDMESGINGWTADSPWTQIATDSVSPTHSWADNNNSPPIYDNDLDIALVSPVMDLSWARDVRLVFQHRYELENSYDFGRVEVSGDGGSSWVQLAEYTGYQWAAGFQEVSISVPDTYLTSTARVRFRMETDFSLRYNGWRLDDVKLESSYYPLQESTLMVKLKEGASIQFTGGSGTAIQDGDLIVQQGTGAYGTVVGDPILSSGTWGVDAAGLIVLNKLSAANFQNGFPVLNVGGTQLAVYVDGSFRAKDNYIRVYYGTSAGYGTPNSDPFDEERHGNPRCLSSCSALEWPPENVANTVADNDYWTLVKWDLLNSNVFPEEVFVPSLQEEDAIIRSSDNNFRSPAAIFVAQPEIGLHAYGHGAICVYYDDFGLRLNVPRITGFLPGVQK